MDFAGELSRFGNIAAFRSVRFSDGQESSCLSGTTLAILVELETIESVKLTMEASVQNGRMNLLAKLQAFVETVKILLREAFDYLGRAADRKNFDFYYRRSYFAALVLFIIFNVILDWLMTQPALVDDSPFEQAPRNISARTLIVLNAVPRTSLNQKRVKVPMIKEVPFALEEINVPKPEFGAIDFGPDQPVENPGTGTGLTSGKLPYRRPELLMLVPPVYPREAEKKGIEGTVALRVLVTEKGTVDQVEIEQSSGYSDMDDAAVKAAKKTRFRPAVKDGERVAMWINYPIQFALTKKPD